MAYFQCPSPIILDVNCPWLLITSRLPLVLCQLIIINLGSGLGLCAMWLFFLQLFNTLYCTCCTGQVFILWYWLSAPGCPGQQRSGLLWQMHSAGTWNLNPQIHSHQCMPYCATIGPLKAKNSNRINHSVLVVVSHPVWSKILFAMGASRHTVWWPFFLANTHWFQVE